MKHIHLVILSILFFAQGLPSFAAVESTGTQTVLFSAASENSPTQAVIPDLLGDENGEVYTNGQAGGIADPLEPMNRFFFEFNDRLYVWVLKPVSRGYMWVLPQEIRECVGNFFRNLRTPTIFLNVVLQGDLQTSVEVVERFLINSTIGVLGLADVAASEFGIPAKRADFGQTLGRWGLGEGIYLFWPVVGPSNIRDSVGVAADSFTEPLPYLHDNRLVDVSLYSTNMVNTLSLKPDLYEDLKKYALDPYIASRQVYTEYRRKFLAREE
jgi:phospholipid-binding lipoprotein MlaA